MDDGVMICGVDLFMLVFESAGGIRGLFKNLWDRIKFTR